ncbi:hypothetical protein [Seohaeicola zhoushanensis]|uniref:Uncharacterized protein n=1 Tax=Seohaeicola zhoushanensis TaxID=1569283 RepID=A0A8J3GVG7_9RHOB|nr:hypothetical protein [Seohaeicola zhoushanensis]GHF43628.1 hypothetical protein GCM10017056_14410 [Seohaeicola zhoushanensis]
MNFELSGKANPLLVAEFDSLMEAVARVQQSHPFRLDAWVALPDRLLCVWTLPAGDMDTVGRWRAIRRAFAGAIGPGRVRWRAAEPPRLITGVVDYAESVRRCWFAPVRRGLVSRPEDWLYSSIQQDGMRAA